MADKRQKGVQNGIGCISGYAFLWKGFSRCQNICCNISYHLYYHQIHVHGIHVFQGPIQLSPLLHLLMSPEKYISSCNFQIAILMTNTITKCNTLMYHSSPPLIRSWFLQWEIGLIRGVASLEGVTSILSFQCIWNLSWQERWPLMGVALYIRGELL